MIPFSWIFQQPTYLLEKENLQIYSYNCDSSKDSCKVNFDFRTSIPSDSPATHFSCLIDFWFGITGEENKCNPNTVEFPLWTWDVHLIVRKIEDETIVSEWIVTIVYPDDTIDPLKVTHVREWQSPTYLIDREDLSRSEYLCDPDQSECKINLNIIPMLDGAPTSLLTCIVSSDFELIPTSDPCNPNTSTVPKGDHVLEIKILDKKDTILQISSVTIKNTFEDILLDPSRITITREWQTPTHLTDIENTELNEYVCDSDSPECKINLKVIPLLDWVSSSLITCEILSDFELTPTSDPCNPNTSVVPIWVHTLVIKIIEKNTENVIKIEEISVNNIRENNSIDPTRVVIDIVWQQPTYFLEKEDTSRDIYICDSTKSPCRFNIQIIPKIDWEESTKLVCRITTDFGIEMDNCNPSTIDVPEGNHSITIDLLDAVSREIVTTRMLEIVWLMAPVNLWGGGTGTFIPMDLLSSEIIVQSGLDESYVCKTDLCQVNFDTKVVSGALCEWDFWGGIFETIGTDKKCNPGYVNFPTETAVKLTVKDPYDITNTFIKTLFVTREPNKSIQNNSFIAAKIDLQTKITTNKKITNTGIICSLGKAESCSLNFTGENSIGGKSWAWDFGNWIMSDKENPWTQKFPIGKYIIRLTISDWVSSHTVLYDVEVVIKIESEPCAECDRIRWKIQISAVLPNPPRADTVEWIEIKNISNEDVSLQYCEIADDTKSYELSGVIQKWRTIRLRQAVTGITLGNTRDSLTIHCGGSQIDTFAWDFTIPTNYILRRDVLYALPEQAIINRVIDGDTVDATVLGVKTRIRLLGIDTPETVHPRKEIEQFGKEASDFTRLSLEWKNVWLTYDHEPIDHYWRRLAYIWLCDGVFSELACRLFNARIVSEGFGRMERRFQFRFYDDFIKLEKEAKESKTRIWNSRDLTKEFNQLSREEKDDLELQQDQEYLKLQKELLEECLREYIEVCDSEKISWVEITKKLSTLSVKPAQSWLVEISGRTWGRYPVTIQILQWEAIIETFFLQSDAVGDYSMIWIPLSTGEYFFRVFIQDVSKDESIEGQGESVTLEKNITQEIISPHLTTPFTASIVLQWQMTNNRRQSNHIFYCQTRGSCSINLVANSNRDKYAEYIWILPEGGVEEGKNPTSFTVWYWKYEALLIATDTITQEVIVVRLEIVHTPLPKKTPQKATSAKYTLDLKDVPQDIWGWPISETPRNKFIIHILIILSIWSWFIFLYQKP